MVLLRSILEEGFNSCDTPFLFEFAEFPFQNVAVPDVKP